MNDGYIKIPRSLLKDPIWKSFPLTYQQIYLKLLEQMVFQKCVQDDFGVPITLYPGQLLTTFRRMVDLCDRDEIDRRTVERAFARFKSCAFSGHETGHRKTIVTILRNDILELIGTKNGTGNGTNSGQTRDIKEERKEREEEAASATALAIAIEKVTKAIIDKKLPLKIPSIKKLFKKYSFDLVARQLDLFAKERHRGTDDKTAIFTSLCNEAHLEQFNKLKD